jgi:hypothetical protein
LSLWNSKLSFFVNVVVVVVVVVVDVDVVVVDLWTSPAE